MSDSLQDIKPARGIPAENALGWKTVLDRHIEGKEKYRNLRDVVNLLDDIDPKHIEALTNEVFAVC